MSSWKDSERPVVPDFEIPYHTEIMSPLTESTLTARERSQETDSIISWEISQDCILLLIAYARDFMINRGFTYCVPPFMIRSNVVTGVMSFAEMDRMMYKIEGEDLYLIGTSGAFYDRQIYQYTAYRR